MKFRKGIAVAAITFLTAGNITALAQNNNSAQVVVITKAQFISKINAYEIANGQQSETQYDDLMSQMRTFISDLKAQLAQNPNSTAINEKMNSRINAYNEAVQKNKANNKAGVIAAFNAFAQTL